MAEETKKTGSSSFPFFKIISILAVIYIIIIALNINVPYINKIPSSYGLLACAIIFLFNILSNNDSRVKRFKKDLVNNLEK